MGHQIKPPQFSASSISNTPILGIQKHPMVSGIVHFKHIYTMYPKTLFLTYVVQSYVRWGRQVKTPRFLALSISNTPILCIQKHCSLHIWCAGMCDWGATHPRYPKTLWLAYLVQKYGCWGRQVKTPRFLALSISNIPILGIQKHCFWHLWCRGMCVWGARSKPHNFWHCPIQTHPF